MKVFIEEQRFTQRWLLIVIFISMIPPIAIIINTYVKSNQMSTTEFISALTLVTLSCCVIFIFKLKTRIDEFGIHYKFFPFHIRKRIISWNEITSIEVRKYDAVSKYGGWGLKGGAFWNKNKGQAINVKGDIGIQLLLKKGKKLLIGTQKKEEAIQVIKNYQK
ncbi:hypothetical protein [Flavicella marina]|uniref:hypothetical protein n=1 Tax=Flavicella marina TaxID=1475951 RepID=UPI00186B3367|nr:hypothetical protein [Flavicella marina]